jgi:hypothetical protein
MDWVQGCSRSIWCVRPRTALVLDRRSGDENGMPVIKGVLIHALDIRVPDPDGARYGPGLTHFGRVIKIQVQKMPNEKHVFEIRHYSGFNGKIRQFPGLK